MKNLKTLFGVQSYCYRDFKSHPELIAKLKETGVRATELCAVHVNFSDEASFDGVIQQYKDAGIAIVSIGVQGFNGVESADRKSFEFARKAGAKCISVHFAPASSPDSWRTTEKLCAEYGIPVGIHNHGGAHWLGSSEMLRPIFNNTNDSIGLCLDTAWALDAGENPVHMADEFAQRLYGLHIKDFIFKKNRRQEDVVIGTGNLDLPALVERIRANDNVKSCVIEYEGDAANPVPALKECVQRLVDLC